MTRKQQLLKDLKTVGEHGARKAQRVINRGTGDLFGALEMWKASTYLLRCRLYLLDAIADKRVLRLTEGLNNSKRVEFELAEARRAFRVVKRLLEAR